MPIPSTDNSAENSPRAATVKMSPYPTVVNVVIAHQNVAMIFGNASGWASCSILYMKIDVMTTINRVKNSVVSKADPTAITRPRRPVIHCVRPTWVPSTIEKSKGLSVARLGPNTESNHRSTLSKSTTRRSYLQDLYAFYELPSAMAFLILKRNSSTKTTPRTHPRQSTET